MTAPGDGLAAARALHARGIAANNAHRPAVGAALLRRALARLEPDGSAAADALRGRVRLSLALSMFELRGPDEALAVLDELAVLAARTGDITLEVLGTAQRGRILLRAGRLSEAEAELDAAAARRREMLPIDRCNVLISRGALLMGAGRLAPARHDLRIAARLASRHGFRLEAHKATHNLGYVEFLAGRLPQALELMSAAVEAAPDVPMGISLLDRARVLSEAGLIREADEALAEAGGIFQRDRLPQDTAETEIARAECALLAGDPAAARRLAARAASRLRRRGNQRWARIADLLVLQCDLALGRRPGTIAARAAALATGLAEDGNLPAARMASLLAAEELIARGTSEAARAAVAGAGTARATDPITVRLHARLVAALLAAREADRPAASRIIRSGQDELLAYRARFGSIDLQTASAVHGRRLAELDIALALGTGRPGAVFAAAERARAVSSRLRSLRPPHDERVAQALAELRLVVEQLRVAPDPELHARRRVLERHITAQGWTLPGARGALRPARLADMRDRLADAHTAMAYYVRGGPTLHAVVADERGVRIRHVGDARLVTELVHRARADLDALAHRTIPSAVRAAAAASLARTLKALDGDLLGGLGLDGGRLLVVPTGVLAALPWTLLPSRRGAPVLVAPSATAWWRTSRSRAEQPVRVAAVCGPGLQRAEEEVAAVSRVWTGTEVHAGAAATCAVLRAALGAASVVHIAAHGRHELQNPLFSSLRLADGPLFAHELDQRGGLAEHIVLSACELGLATIRPGDEALGLTSVLLALGSRSVIAGVARIGDEAAEQAMVRYHRSLAAGRDSAQALAESLGECAEDAPVPLVCFGSAWSAARA